MADFRLVVRFENPSCLAVYVVKADDERSAREDFVRMYEAEMLRLEGRNVFVSKRMVDFVSSESKDDVQIVNDHGDLVLPPSDVELFPPGA